MGRASWRAMNQAPHQAECEQRQCDAGQNPAHALELHALVTFQLRSDGREGLLHPDPAHPQLQTSDALARGRRDAALQDERAHRRRLRRRVAAGEQHVPARVQHLDALDIALIEQLSGNRGDRGFVVRTQGGRQGGAGDLAQAVRPRLQIGFELLRHRGVGELIDVRGVDPVFVVRQTAQAQGKARTLRQAPAINTWFSGFSPFPHQSRPTES